MRETPDSACHGLVDTVTGERPDRQRLVPAPVGPPVLSVRDVTVRFGGIVALEGVSFDVAAGQIVGLIGPNGAGKTTLFNCLSRLYTPERGTLEFEGRPIHDTPSHRISALGISRTFQNLALFPSLSVLQNVMIGAHSRSRGDFVSSALRLPAVRSEEGRVRDLARELVAFFGLEGVVGHPAAGLPFGTLKRVELARALAGGPRLLLLDEPAAGLNHEEVAALGGLIRTIRDARGVTVLLVEHHMGLVMEVSDRVVVLDFGRKIAEGSPAEVRHHPDVIRAYLGVAPGETVAR
jgi:branched-chain amino acid transport system ATP-binding protein